MAEFQMDTNAARAAILSNIRSVTRMGLKNRALTKHGKPSRGRIGRVVYWILQTALHCLKNACTIMARAFIKRRNLR